MRRLTPAQSSNRRRHAALQLVRDGEHLPDVVEAGVRAARISVWIASANLKDVHVEASLGTRARANGRYVSLYDELRALAQAGVDVRILHSGAPSRVLQKRLGAKQNVQVRMRCCPRVHLKMIAVDGTMLYLGSANFTGAGLGAKGEDRRNFEAGIVTDDEWLLDEMQSTFDTIWTGKRCKTCRLRSQCGAPLDELRDEKR